MSPEQVAKLITLIKKRWLSMLRGHCDCVETECKKKQLFTKIIALVQCSRLETRPKVTYLNVENEVAEK